MITMPDSAAHRCGAPAPAFFSSRPWRICQRVSVRVRAAAGRGSHVVVPTCAVLKSMRDPEIIETELMEISAIADDSVKFERIIAWCASHPDEVPFALGGMPRYA